MTQPMNAQPGSPEATAGGAEPAPQPTRREVLDFAVAGATVVVAAAAAYPAIRFLAPPGDGKAGPVAVPLADLPPGSARTVEAGGRTIVLIHGDDGEIRAFHAVCTHLGCGLRWAEDARELHCGCHGGRFASDGRVLGGPPPRSLAPLRVDVMGDKVVVAG